MIDLGLKEKLEKLKKLYSGPDAHEDARKQIADWEERIRKLSRDQEFFNHASTQEIYAILKDRVKTHIKSRLGKGLTLEDMRLADARQSECEWMLSLFNVDYEKELVSLESMIDAEL